MLIDIIKRGTTSWRGCIIRIIDSTDGTPETGVVYNTSGIDLWYRREGAAKTSITEATLAAVDSAYSSGGIIHIGDGYYRLDLPDAALASSAGVNFVDVGGTVTGMVVIGGRVKLVDLDYNDAVRAGLTALPNAAAEASGGLYTRGTGAGQINQDANGRIDSNVAVVSASALASINAEVVDTLNTDTYAEPGQGAPGATISLAQKIGYLFKSWRNKKAQDADSWDLYNDDTTTVGQRATVSEAGGTVTKGEIGTGA